jgi:hypothetical protein
MSEYFLCPEFCFSMSKKDKRTTRQFTRTLFRFILSHEIHFRQLVAMISEKEDCEY